MQGISVCPCSDSTVPVTDRTDVGNGTGSDDYRGSAGDAEARSRYRDAGDEVMWPKASTIKIGMCVESP